MIYFAVPFRYVSGYQFTTFLPLSHLDLEQLFSSKTFLWLFQLIHESLKVIPKKLK